MSIKYNDVVEIKEIKSFFDKEIGFTHAVLVVLKDATGRWRIYATGK